MFDRSILKYGDRICQRWKDGPDSVAELSYAQVGRLVMELSAGLMSMGVEKGDRVAIMSVNCPQWLWADFSILNAGGVTVAVYPSLSQREMANIINDAGVKVLYVDGADNLQKVINLSSEMSALHKVIVFNHECLGDDDADIISLDELRGKGREWLVRRPFDYERRWRSVDLFDNMTIIYTSGTTGKHKGAVHTHFSMNAACALDLLSMPPITEEDVFLSVLSLSHSYERQCGQMMALLTGAAIAYAQSPFTLMEDIALFRPTLFMATPSHLEVIYAAIHAKLAADAQSQAKFEEALNAGLAVIEARTDRHGFVDMSEDIDFTAGLHDDLKQDYRRADTEVFSQARALLGGRFRFAFSAAGGLPARLARIFMALGIRIIEGYGLIETCNTVTLNRLPKSCRVR
jgi:long-chain acyl-CoA synthetase